jgi:hypothetical protein
MDSLFQFGNPTAFKSYTQLGRLIENIDPYTYRVRHIVRYQVVSILHEQSLYITAIYALGFPSVLTELIAYLDEMIQGWVYNAEEVREVRIFIEKYIATI